METDTNSVSSGVMTVDPNASSQTLTSTSISTSPTINADPSDNELHILQIPEPTPLTKPAAETVPRDSKRHSLSIIFPSVKYSHSSQLSTSSDFTTSSSSSTYFPVSSSSSSSAAPLLPLSSSSPRPSSSSSCYSSSTNSAPLETTWGEVSAGSIRSSSTNSNHTHTSVLSHSTSSPSLAPLSFTAEIKRGRKKILFPKHPKRDSGHLKNASLSSEGSSYSNPSIFSLGVDSSGDWSTVFNSSTLSDRDHLGEKSVIHESIREDSNSPQYCFQLPPANSPSMSDHHHAYPQSDSESEYSYKRNKISHIEQHLNYMAETTTKETSQDKVCLENQDHQEKSIKEVEANANTEKSKVSEQRENNNSETNSSHLLNLSQQQPADPSQLDDNIVPEINSDKEEDADNAINSESNIPKLKPNNTDKDMSINKPQQTVTVPKFSHSRCSSLGSALNFESNTENETVNSSTQLTSSISSPISKDNNNKDKTSSLANLNSSTSSSTSNNFNYDFDFNLLPPPSLASIHSSKSTQSLPDLAEPSIFGPLELPSKAASESNSRTSSSSTKEPIVISHVEPVSPLPRKVVYTKYRHFSDNNIYLMEKRAREMARNNHNFNLSHSSSTSSTGSSLNNNNSDGNKKPGQLNSSSPHKLTPNWKRHSLVESKQYQKSVLEQKRRMQEARAAEQQPLLPHSPTSDAPSLNVKKNPNHGGVLHIPKKRGTNTNQFKIKRRTVSFPLVGSSSFHSIRYQEEDEEEPVEDSNSKKRNSLAELFGGIAKNFKKDKHKEEEKEAKKEEEYNQYIPYKQVPITREAAISNYITQDPQEMRRSSTHSSEESNYSLSQKLFKPFGTPRLDSSTFPLLTSPIKTSFLPSPPPIITKALPPLPTSSAGNSPITGHFPSKSYYPELPPLPSLPSHDVSPTGTATAKKVSSTGSFQPTVTRPPPKSYPSPLQEEDEEEEEEEEEEKPVVEKEEETRDEKRESDDKQLSESIEIEKPLTPVKSTTPIVASTSDKDGDDKMVDELETTPKPDKSVDEAPQSAESNAPLTMDSDIATELTPIASKPAKKKKKISFATPIDSELDMDVPQTTSSALESGATGSDSSSIQTSVDIHVKGHQKHKSSSSDEHSSLDIARRQSLLRQPSDATEQGDLEPSITPMSTKFPRTHSRSSSNHRLSIAPSLAARHSLISQYSPVIEQATEVSVYNASSSSSTSPPPGATAGAATTESTPRYSAMASSSRSPSAESASSISASQQISLEKVRETTSELELILSNMRSLRKSSTGFASNTSSPVHTQQKPKFGHQSSLSVSSTPLPSHPVFPSPSSDAQNSLVPSAASPVPRPATSEPAYGREYIPTVSGAGIVSSIGSNSNIPEATRQTSEGVSAEVLNKDLPLLPDQQPQQQDSQRESLDGSSVTVIPAHEGPALNVPQYPLPPPPQKSGFRHQQHSRSHSLPVRFADLEHAESDTSTSTTGEGSQYPTSTSHGQSLLSARAASANLMAFGASPHTEAPTPSSAILNSDIGMSSSSNSSSNTPGIGPGFTPPASAPPILSYNHQQDHTQFYKPDSATSPALSYKTAPSSPHKYSVISPGPNDLDAPPILPFVKNERRVDSPANEGVDSSNESFTTARSEYSTPSPDITEHQKQQQILDQRNSFVGMGLSGVQTSPAELEARRKSEELNRTRMDEQHYQQYPVAISGRSIATSHPHSSSEPNSMDAYPHDPTVDLKARQSRDLISSSSSVSTPTHRSQYPSRKTSSNYSVAGQDSSSFDSQRRVVSNPTSQYHSSSSSVGNRVSSLSTVIPTAAASNALFSSSENQSTSTPHTQPTSSSSQDLRQRSASVTSKHQRTTSSPLLSSMPPPPSSAMSQGSLLSSSDGYERTSDSKLTNKGNNAIIPSPIDEENKADQYRKSVISSISQTSQISQPLHSRDFRTSTGPEAYPINTLNRLSLIAAQQQKRNSYPAQSAPQSQHQSQQTKSYPMSAASSSGNIGGPQYKASSSLSYGSKQQQQQGSSQSQTATSSTANTTSRYAAYLQQQPMPYDYSSEVQGYNNPQALNKDGSVPPIPPQHRVISEHFPPGSGTPASTDPVTVTRRRGHTSKPTHRHTVYDEFLDGEPSRNTEYLNYQQQQYSTKGSRKSAANIPTTTDGGIGLGLGTTTAGFGGTSISATAAASSGKRRHGHSNKSSSSAPLNYYPEGTTQEATTNKNYYSSSTGSNRNYIISSGNQQQEQQNKDSSSAPRRSVLLDRIKAGIEAEEEGIDQQGNNNKNRNSGKYPKRPFSMASVKYLMDLSDATFKLDELDMPPTERQLIEKFVDALAKLSTDITADSHKRQEGVRRLNNALRAIEGWI